MQLDERVAAVLAQMDDHRLRETPGMESVLVPIGNGIEFSRHQS